MTVAPPVPVEPSIADNGDGTLALTYVYEGPLWTVNNDRVDHPMKRANRTRELRAIFAAMAADNPPLEWCDVDCWHEVPTRRVPDTGAAYGCLKAAIDGLVDAAVVPADTADVVRTIIMHPPTTTGRDALVVRVTGPAAGSDRNDAA